MLSSVSGWTGSQHYREATGSGIAALADVVVKGETGFLIEPGNPDDLARGIRRLPEPRDWRALIGKHAATVSWAGMVDALVDAIESASGVL